MESDADARAYDELSHIPRIVDLASIARDVMTAEAQRQGRGGQAEHIDRLVAERNLARGDGATSFGNALDVLARGPAGEGERSLARAIAAHAVALDAPSADNAEPRAQELLWLAARTPFDATGLLEHALGSGASALWRAFAERIRRVDSGARSLDRREADRGEALLAAAALAAADGVQAAEIAARLAAEVRDPKIAYVLRAPARRSSVEPLVGEWSPSPRGPLAAALLGLSGASAVLHASRTLGRLALAYRTPAEVLLSDGGALRIRWRVELLGRTLRARDVLVPPSGLARAVREVRYPRLALYAALLALLLGSYLGAHALVDGVRAGSPSLVATGFVVIAAGLVLDLALTSIAPGARGRCRVLVVPRRGAPLCVGAVDAMSADAMLTRLAETLSGAAAPDAAAQRPSGDSMRSPSTASSRPADA